MALAEHDLAALGGLFEAGGEVDGHADRVMHQHAADADRAEDDLAGVDADPEAHRAVMAGDGFLDGERGEAGAQGVVLGHRGGAEDGHDAVAATADGAVEALGGADHGLQRGVEQAGGVLGVEAADHGGRAHHVGEHDGDAAKLGLRRVALGACGVRRVHLAPPPAINGPAGAVQKPRRSVVDAGQHHRDKLVRRGHLDGLAMAGDDGEVQRDLPATAALKASARIALLSCGTPRSAR